MIRRIGAAGDVGLDAVGARLRAIAANLAFPTLLARERRPASLLLGDGSLWSFGLLRLFRSRVHHGVSIQLVQDDIVAPDFGGGLQRSTCETKTHTTNNISSKSILSTLQIFKKV